MPLGSDASPGAGSPAAARGQIIRDCRRELRGKTVPLGHKEPVSRYAQSGVMVKAAPASAFVMTESEFLLEFLVIPFDHVT
jgi:hypothetical protein